MGYRAPVRFRKDHRLGRCLPVSSPPSVRVYACALPPACPRFRCVLSTRSSGRRALASGRGDCGAGTPAGEAPRGRKLCGLGSARLGGGLSGNRARALSPEAVVEAEGAGRAAAAAPGAARCGLGGESWGAGWAPALGPRSSWACEGMEVAGSALPGTLGSRGSSAGPAVGATVGRAPERAGEGGCGMIPGETVGRGSRAGCASRSALSRQVCQERGVPGLSCLRWSAAHLPPLVSDSPKGVCKRQSWPLLCVC